MPGGAPGKPGGRKPGGGPGMPGGAKGMGGRCREGAPTKGSKSSLSLIPEQKMNVQ